MGRKNINCTWEVLFETILTDWGGMAYATQFVTITVRQLNARPVDFNTTERFSLQYSLFDLPGMFHSIEVSELLEHDVVFQSPAPLTFHLRSNTPHVSDYFILEVVGPEEGTVYRNGSLPVVRLTENAGYVTSPNFDGVSSVPGYPHFYTGYFVLNVSANHSVFISFVTINFKQNTYWPYDVPSEHWPELCHDYVVLTIGLKTVWQTKCLEPSPQPQVYRDSILITFHSDIWKSSVGFKMMYALVPRQHEPQQISGGGYNCSVPHFEAFAPVLRCNMAVECQEAEDERDCKFPYESPECGPGLFDVGKKCYRVIPNRSSLTWYGANAECHKHGETLVTTATVEEEKVFMRVMATKKDSNCVYLGLQRLGSDHFDFWHPPVALMYRNLWRWTDGRTAFSLKMNKYHDTVLTLCAMVRPGFDNDLYLPIQPIWCHQVNEYQNCDVICEKSKHDNGDIYQEKDSSTSVGFSDAVWNVSVVACPAGHVVRDILSCDPESQCGAEDYMTSCEIGNMKTPMFVCELSETSVHYSLVCDYIQHCSDKSDENFCHYEKCLALECQNGQCLSIGQECDRNVQCADCSDERFCLKHAWEGYEFINTIATPKNLPPFLVHIDSVGNYTLIDLENSDYCPFTHFLCPEGICLPRHLRCNNIDDCPGREDEAGCETYTCPGLYRCWRSQVCLYPDQVCDGVRHCPQQDDEMLCDLDPCPDVCQCQTLAFVCSQSFNTSIYSSLRLLDASGSGMTLESLEKNRLLVYADLSHCGFNKLQHGTLPNLRYLDLSWNQLFAIDFSQFVFLKNLRVLILSGNPVSTILVDHESFKAVTLHELDLSHSLFPVYNGSAFAACSNLRILNLSRSQVAAVSDGGFYSTPLLEIVDVRNSPLTVFPDDVLRNLTALKAMYSDNFKLCCPAILPQNFLLQNCHSSEDQLSSCADLFRVHFHRIFVGLCAALAIVGNIGSFFAMTCKRDSSADSFAVFVYSLNLADFLMGVYLAVIGIADSTFHGQYLFYDLLWRNSTACRTAGFLSLLSSEVSAFNICLITLDRALVLRYPCSKVHFSHLSALVLCVVIWTVGAALALIPLLPMSSHWQFFSQTSICTPLPFQTSERYLGYSYSFGVLIMLNFALCVITACGEAVSSWSYISLSIKDSSHQRFRKAIIAGRFTTVVVSDILCWLPVGLLGLLSYGGSSGITDDVNVAIVIFVLPINSALNPFLYMYNVVMEKRRKTRREMLIRKLKTQLVRK